MNITSTSTHGLAGLIEIRNRLTEALLPNQELHIIGWWIATNRETFVKYNITNR